MGLILWYFLFGALIGLVIGGFAGYVLCSCAVTRALRKATSHRKEGLELRAPGVNSKDMRG
jgi:hypothetical protein